MAIRELLERIRATEDCEVYPAAGLPQLRTGDILPDDVREFYELCGGVSLYLQTGQAYRVTIVPPVECVLANPVIIGELADYDISSHWYIIVRDDAGEYVTIDFAPQRLGRCYDSFFDRYGLRGSTDIVALSFTELLTRLYASGGKRRYWAEPDFLMYGDAYDGVPYKDIP